MRRRVDIKLYKANFENTTSQLVGIISRTLARHEPCLFKIGITHCMEKRVIQYYLEGYMFVQTLFRHDESSVVGNLEKQLISRFRELCNNNQKQKCHNIRHGGDSLFKLDAHPPPYYLYLAVASGLDIHQLMKMRRTTEGLVASKHRKMLGLSADH